ncbi:MAG: RNA polymerase sigma-54 factor [Phycisphaerales bacterium]|nr:RNA polymerase sigma-54 factor [Phycisphaerales bacterium]
MRFDLSQQAHLRLGQQLKLSPRVIQSMEILQMPLTTLEERIENELESNVALEQEEGEHTAESIASPTGADATDAPPADDPPPAGLDRFQRAQELHDRSEDDSAAENWRESARLDGEFDPRAAALASAPAQGQNLEDVLLDQWALCEASAPIMVAGRVLLSNIDENGFLSRTLEEIAQECADQSPDSPDLPLLTEALKRLQMHLEPVGIAARNLAECITLQLDAREANEPPSPSDTRFADARLLVETDLQDLKMNRASAIRHRHEWTRERLDGAREMLRRCDPAPARSLVVESATVIRADAIIEYDTVTDTYSARLANGVLPNLRVSEEYLKILKAKRTDEPTKILLTDGIKRAQWFIDAIEQRGATLLRVVNQVIANQREWLDVGGGSLKPLPMTQVAREMELNVSTISRAVAGKWIETPRGVFELRKLFAGGTETESGSDISWVAVKAVVQEVISGEDKSAPLSDAAIALALKARGIPLARRTVVKYREQLGLPAARLRQVSATD